MSQSLLATSRSLLYRLLIIPALLSATLLAGSFFLTTHSVLASGGGAHYYVHTVTAANSGGAGTTLNDANLNGNPNAFLLVTPVLGSYLNHPIGVWYNSSTARWAIFNQDFATMPAGTAFNIKSLPYSNTTTGYEGVSVHKATTASLSGSTTYLDIPTINNQPTMRLHITANWNPGGVGGVYNNHPIGVWYSTSMNKWAIFNQDGAAMPANASFNVEYESPIVVSVFTHTTTASNKVSNYTILDSTYTNDNPNAVLLVTLNWNPNGSGGTSNNHHIGTWYSSSLHKWTVFNQDYTAIPNNASFNVLVGTP